MDELTMASSDRIYSSEFGKYQYREFLCWAFVQRQTKAMFIRNIAVARTDANRDQTQQGMAYYAKLMGWTEEELADWIEAKDAEGVSTVQMHSLLRQVSTERSDEPIDSLQLSNKAVKALQSLNVQTIGELLAIAPDDVLNLKGVGQGTVDEIQAAVKAKLEIDWNS